VVDNYFVGDSVTYNYFIKTKAHSALSPCFIILLITYCIIMPYL